MHIIESLQTPNAILTMVSYPDFEEEVFCYFHNYEKVFRLSDVGEFEYLKAQGLEKVTDKIEDKLSEDALKMFPKYLGSLEVIADFENYYWAKSNNGGCYAHYSMEHYFLLPTGEIGLLEENKTGSEFRETFDGDNIGDFAKTMDMRFAIDFVAYDWAELNDLENSYVAVNCHEELFNVKFNEEAFLRYLDNICHTEYTSKYDDNGICCGKSEKIVSELETIEIKKSLLRRLKKSF